jgi:hypothetical protein
LNNHCETVSYNPSEEGLESIVRPKVIEQITTELKGQESVTIKLNRNDYDKFVQICKDWEKLTSLELEYVHYNKMIIRDVNYLRRNLSNCGKLLRA